MKYSIRFQNVKDGGKCKWPPFILNEPHGIKEETVELLPLKIFYQEAEGNVMAISCEDHIFVIAFNIVTTQPIIDQGVCHG